VIILRSQDNNQTNMKFAINEIHMYVVSCVSVELLPHHRIWLAITLWLCVL
jgi:hypothetical protein